MSILPSVNNYPVIKKRFMILVANLWTISKINKHKPKLIFCFEVFTPISTLSAVDPPTSLFSGQLTSDHQILIPHGF